MLAPRYVPAASVVLDRLGRPAGPSTLAAPGDAAAAAPAVLPGSGTRLARRIRVTKGNRQMTRGGGFKKETTRGGGGGDAEEELQLPPPPPPRGWEILFDRVSGRNYYASVRGTDVRWDPPV